MENETNEKNYSKLQWFFYVILIPLVFAVTLSLVILTVAGLNIFEIAKSYGDKIPFVSAIIDKDEEKEEQSENNTYSLQATIEDQNASIQEYEAQISKQEETIKSLESELKNLKDQLANQKNEKEQSNVKLESLAQIYEEMSSKNAAAILSELEVEDTIDILLLMNNETRAQILQKMSTEMAANITKQLKKRSQ